MECRGQIGPVTQHGIGGGGIAFAVAVMGRTLVQGERGKQAEGCATTFAGPDDDAQRGAALAGGQRQDSGRAEPGGKGGKHLGQAICAKGEEVLRVRSGFVGETLARLYNPGGMPTELRSAHQGLDREIDSAFGCSNGTLSLLERQEILFSRYEDLIAAEGRP